MTAATHVRDNDSPGQKGHFPSPGRQAREKKEFIRFGKSPLWEMQTRILAEGLRVTHPIENTCLASAWVEMILAYWRDMLAGGLIDPEDPLYIFQQGAGSGKFSWYMIRLLQERLRENNFQELTPVYLICDPSLANLEYCRQHPKLAPYIEARCVDLVLWDGCTDGMLHLQNTFRAIDGNSVKNPVVFVANHHFGKLRQDLFYIHYGKLFEGEIALNRAGKGAPDSFAACLPEYRWTEIENPARLPKDCQKLMDRYIRRLDNTSLLIPTGGLEAVGAMKRLSRGNMMLLSSDTGYHREKDLRFNGEPDMTLCGSIFLPVNYDAVNRFAENLGARACTAQTGRDDILFSVLVFSETTSEKNKGPNTGILESCFYRNFKSSNPADRMAANQVIARHTDTLASSQVLSFLRQNLYDPAVFECSLPRFSTAEQALHPEDRLAWIDAVQRVWHNAYLEFETDAALFETGLLAMDLGAWGTAGDIFRTARGFYGDDPACLYNLALCYFNIGDLERAKRCLAPVPETNEEKSHDKALLSNIRTWEKAWAELAWYDETLCRHQDIILVPLEPEHAAVFHYQYRDPAIGILTRLPELNNEDEVGKWIREERADKDRALFAVFQEEYGFVGSVSLAPLHHTGYFYFWIGTDYQNSGFGKKAANCLMNMMQTTCGIKTVYTSAYKDNIRSQNALGSLGFEALTFEAAPPDEDVLFFRKGPFCGDRVKYDELTLLLNDTASPMVLKCERMVKG